MADEKPTYENNTLRRAYERASDQLDDALKQEGEDIADSLGVGGDSESSQTMTEILSVLREILSLQREQRVEVNQRLEEIRSAVEDSGGGGSEWQ